MRKWDFLKTSLKGVLFSNILNSCAMEEKDYINTDLKNEIIAQLSNKYINEQTMKILKKANINNLKKYENPNECSNSEKIKDYYNRMKNIVIKKIEEKKIEEKIKNEIIISNKEEDEKQLKDYFIGTKLNHNLVDGIAKYINQGYIFHLFEYKFNLLRDFYNISEDEYNYFNKFVVTVTVSNYCDNKVINDDYKGKVNVKKIGEFNFLKLKTYEIIADIDCLEKLFYFADIKDVLKIINYVDKYEKVNINNFFSNCSCLKYINFIGFNTENVTDMGYMFDWCCNLKKLDLSCFNTDRVTNMEYMFHNCRNLEYLNLKNFNTENVKNFCEMFGNCENLKNLNTEDFNFKNAKNCSFMFSGCYKLEKLNLENLNISDISDVSYMFDDCKNLKEVKIGKAKYKTETLIISSNKTKTTNTRRMFNNCEKLKYLELYIHGDSNINKYVMYDNCKNLCYENFKTNRVDLLLYIINKALKKSYIESKIKK